MAWHEDLSCADLTAGSASKILEQINNITAHFSNEIIMSSDISGFDIETGLGIVGTPFEGFGICDGRNGTPDLRGRFVVGFDVEFEDYNSFGITGGEKEVTLTWQQSGLRDHTHSKHRPEVYGGGGNGAIGDIQTIREVLPNNTGGEPQNYGIDALEAHENRPPYFVVFYYKKI